MVLSGTGGSGAGLFLLPFGQPLILVGEGTPVDSTYASINGYAVSRNSYVAAGSTTSGQGILPCPLLAPCKVITVITCIPCFTDTDGDGITDADEASAKCGIDNNGDGTVDYDFDFDNNGSCDVNAAVPHVIIEVDYLDCTVAADAPAGLPADCAGGDNHNHKPIQAGVNNVVTAFAAGLVAVNLHVEVDEALAHANNLDFPGGGPACNPGGGGAGGIASFNAVKNIHFGTVAERGNAQTLAAKGKVAHYALFTHQQAAGNTSSGCGEEPGNDFYVSLGGWVNPTQGDEEGTFMHELGHNLNLCHGGPKGGGAESDFQCDVNYKPNYLSVMNYTFQTPNTPDGQATGRPLDYSRWVLPPGPVAPCVGGPVVSMRPPWTRAAASTTATPARRPAWRPVTPPTPTPTPASAVSRSSPLLGESTGTSAGCPSRASASAVPTSPPPSTIGPAGPCRATRSRASSRATTTGRTFGTNVPPSSARFDINEDGKIGLSDILMFIPFFNLSCTP